MIIKTIKSCGHNYQNALFWHFYSTDSACREVAEDLSTYVHFLSHSFINSYLEIKLKVCIFFITLPVYRAILRNTIKPKTNIAIERKKVQTKCRPGHITKFNWQTVQWMRLKWDWDTERQMKNCHTIVSLVLTSWSEKRSNWHDTKWFKTLEVMKVVFQWDKLFYKRSRLS